MSGRPEADGPTRTKALVAFALVLVLAIAAWVLLSRAADTGVERIARIDRMRAECETAWRAARNERDTMDVDRTALADTIDPGADAQLARCGDLRAKGLPNAMPNQRDMTRPQMPSPDR